MLKNINRYKLRKLTIGLVSVSAGLLFAVQTPKMVKADNINTPQTENVEQNKASQSSVAKKAVTTTDNISNTQTKNPVSATDNTLNTQAKNPVSANELSASEAKTETSLKKPNSASIYGRDQSTSVMVSDSDPNNSSGSVWVNGAKNYDLAINGGDNLTSIDAKSLVNTNNAKSVSWVYDANGQALDSTHQYNTKWSNSHNSLTAYIKVLYNNGQSQILPVNVGIKSDAEQYDVKILDDLDYFNTHGMYSSNAPRFTGGLNNPDIANDTTLDGDIDHKYQADWSYDVNNIVWKTGVTKQQIDLYKSIIKDFSAFGRHANGADVLPNKDTNGNYYAVINPGINVIYADGSQTIDIRGDRSPTLNEHVYHEELKNNDYTAYATDSKAFTADTAKSLLTNIAPLNNITRNYDWLISDNQVHTIDKQKVTGFRELTSDDIKAAGSKTFYVMVRYTKTNGNIPDGYYLLPVSVTLKENKQLITYDKPSTTVTGAMQDDLNSKGTRTITITFPNGYTPTADWINSIKNLLGHNTITNSGNVYKIVQTVYFARNAVYDVVNGKVSYITPTESTKSYSSGWNLKPGEKTDSYSGFDLPNIPGYKPQIVNNPLTGEFMGVEFAVMPTSYQTSAGYDMSDPTTKKNANRDVLVSGYDPLKISVHVDIKDGNENITKLNPITIKVANGNEFKDIDVDKEIENAKNSPWDVKYIGNGTYTAYYKGNKIPTSFDLDFNIMGSVNGITKKTTITPVVTVKLPNNKVATYTLKSHDYLPYTEGIDQYSLLKGFRIGDTTVGNEAYWGNIGSSDLPYVKKYDSTASASNGKVISSSNQPLHQYGIYFNYNKSLAKDLRSYIQALFDVKFGGVQQLLPTTIKVFAVPDTLIGTKTDRIKIGDNLPASFNEPGKTVYNYITDYANHLERPDLEQILRSYASAKDNTMSFAKKNAQNKFDDNTAYFIQVDTIGPKGDQPVFTTWKYKGKGIVSSVVTPYYGEGSKATDDGGQTTKPVEPVQPTNPPQPTSGGQTTKASQPTKPVQPTKPTSPSQTTKTSQPTKPVQPTKPTNPSQTTKTSQPTKPNQGKQNSEPPKPVQQPTEPTNPTSPSQPTQTSQASEPISHTPAFKAPHVKNIDINNHKLTFKRAKTDRKQMRSNYQTTVVRRQRLSQEKVNKHALRVEKINNVNPKGKTVKVSGKINKLQAKLPQTSDKKNNKLPEIAGALISLVGITALAYFDSKHKNK